MIRMLVVEDEKVIRDGLMKHVPWQELGVGEVRSAANAGDALDISRRFLPDIICSDIRMPGMNGVELCTKMRELFPDITILFLTGYSDKEYLKAAITLHAVRYVEKPIQMAEYRDAVEEAVRRVRQIRERRASEFRTITFGEEKEFLLKGKYERIALLYLEKPEAAPLVREKLSEQVVFLQKEYSFHFLMQQRDTDTIMLLFGYNDDYSDARREQLLGLLDRRIELCADGETRWFLSYGSPVDHAEKLRDTWKQAEYGLGTLAYLGWNRRVVPADWEQKDHAPVLPAELTEPMETALDTNDVRRQIESLENLRHFLLEHEVFLRPDIRFLYVNWYQRLLQDRRQKNLKERVHQAMQEKIPVFERVQTWQEMHGYLMEVLTELSVDADSGDNGSSYVVQKVTEYISQHYGERDLSIRVLADQVGLTPTYLSNLFKKDLGITIGQYLMDVRMEHAKHLMRDPQRKIYEIADQVGYEDVDYFSRVFKRAAGMTPSEYRKKEL